MREIVSHRPRLLPISQLATVNYKLGMVRYSVALVI